MTARRPLVLAAEALLVAVTLAAVLGMSRLFDGGGWLGPLAVNAVAAHAAAAAMRRRGLSLPVAAALMVVGAGIVVTWSSYWSTTMAGVPTGDTWSAMRVDLGDAWVLYQDVSAPAPVEPGFVLASCVALWVIAYVADWAAFRLWVPFEATLPAGTLFLFTSLLGSDRGRGWAVALYATTLLAFLLVHRMARQDGSAHWVADRRSIGNRSLLTAGAGLGAVAVLVGTVFGPAVPGADSTGLLDPRSLRGDDNARVEVSPLVDIRSRLVDQSAVEVFTVRSPERSYWRLTSLERFDGTIWKSSGSFGSVDGALPESVEADVATSTFEQSFTISALAQVWLPSAYEPRALRSPNVKVRYDEESATLIVDDDIARDGVTYQVSSASPRITPGDLAGAGGDFPEDIRDRFLELPKGFSPSVRALARELTAGAAGPAAQARALQDYLREFDYSLEVQDGHSEDALEDFLFTTQVGYCEQFAGAFAAMARSIGLPARVAVGFTPGEEDADEPGLYRVRGEYAHAWPEVYIPGAGWVLYEPTPGRGAPNAEAYTDVPEQQAAENNPRGTVTVPSTATTEPLAPGTAPTFNGLSPDDRLDAVGGFPDGRADSSDSVPTRYLTQPATRLAPFAGVAIVGYAILFPLGLFLWRSLRRRRADTPLAQIELAWTETVEDAALVGYDERASDTYFERAHNLAAALGGAEEAAFTLARCREAAAYSAAGADEQDSTAAGAAAEELRSLARDRTSRRTRITRWIDPRSLVRGWRRDHTARQRRITLTARGDMEQERELVGSSDRG